MKTIVDSILSEKFRAKTERTVVWIAIVGYLIHLLVILLVSQDLIHLTSKFTSNPISAVYTPFSFILIYEVFLLVFYLPRSISSYIGKQYEIITLIVIRRIFKDIGKLELTSDWFKLKNDLQFSYDVATALILFFLIRLFYNKIKRNEGVEIHRSEEERVQLNRFIELKRWIAAALVPVLVFLAVYAFSNWLIVSFQSNWSDMTTFKNINNVFFEDFFLLLIVIDVLLLLFSFLYSDKFSEVIRNSGFVISTILIKISFSVDGLIKNALIIGAVLFGYLILLISNSYTNGTLQSKQ